jgi:hypothetical protein
VGYWKKPAPAKSTVTIHSEDQQIVRIEGHAGLDRRHRDYRPLGSIGAEIQRLIRAIEVEHWTGPRELVVAGCFEQGGHVHARGQPAPETAGGDGDVTVSVRLLKFNDIVVIAIEEALLKQRLLSNTL